MYKIIGTDQKEYGPVSSDQIHQWIAQGRINAQTRAQSDGGDWKTLGDFPEFATTLANVPPQPRPSPNPRPAPAPPVKTSGLAIASLILGILGIVSCGVTSIVGLILGIVAVVRVNKSNGTLGGNGIAIAGIIVSALLPVFIIPAAMLMPALAKAKQRALTIQCVNNMKQLSLAARMYAAEHNDHFPSGEKWCDDLKQFVGGNERIYRCPAGNLADRCDYAFNSKLAGMDTKNVNPQTVLFFETDTGWNTSGGSELMVNPSRHGRTFVVAFADGHVEQLTVARLANLRWEP